MKAISIILLLILSLPGFAQYKKENLKIDQAATTAYKYENLQLYPIRANKVFEAEHKNLGKYMTLEKALELKKVRVTESKEVNKLFIENLSTDTVMILAGEVVQGGQQDRMVGDDIVLNPRSGKKEIPVFCVEHGRWSEGATGKSFTKYYTISSNEVRKAGAVKKDQGKVWDEVADKTSKNKAETSTGTLAALKESGEFNTKLTKYVSHFEKIIVNEKDVIGVVAVSGDKILGTDMFATHQLFEQHYRNLLHSYATEAISTGKTVTVAPAEVTHYLDAILDVNDDREQEKKVKQNGTMLKQGEKKLHINTY